MSQFIRILISLSLVFIASLTQAKDAKPAASNEVVVKKALGKAYDKNETLIYTERHLESYSKDGKLLSLNTKYYNLDNEQFAELNSDFQKHIYVPDYTYSDSRMGRSDGIKSTDKENLVIAFAKPNKESKLKEKEFSVTEDIVSGQGLYSYVYKNFNELLNMKGSINIKFLIPMQQSEYGFYIKQYSKDETKVVYQIKFSSWIIRMFAPFIQVTYDVKTKRLLEFKGPSNVPGSDGEIQNVTIKYE